MRLSRNKINIVLAKKGINRHQLAESYGCTDNRISAIMNCQEVRPETAAKFADALGVNIEDILDDREARL